jgi:uncharacterized protein (UPF0303 family)
MKKEYKVGDLVRKAITPEMFGVVVDVKIVETGLIYQVHYGEDYGLFWQAPRQVIPFLLDK